MKKYLVILIVIIVVLGDLSAAIYYYKSNYNYSISHSKSNISIRDLLTERKIINDSLYTNTDSAIIVINILESWCAPCFKEIPELSRVVQKYQAKGVSFIALTASNREAITSRFQDLGISFGYDLYYDQEELIKEINTLNNDQKTKMVVPQHIIISKEGSVGLYLTGASDKNIFLIEKFLNDHLK